MFEHFGPLTSRDVPDPILVMQQAMISRSAHYAASTVAADSGLPLTTVPSLRCGIVLER